MNRAAMERELIILREKVIRKARASFWEFCKLESPDFYKQGRWHLELNAWILQALYERRLTKAAFVEAAKSICPPWFIQSGDYLAMVDRLQDGYTYTKLMQNLPPRIGKSRTLVNFCKWVLGQEITNKIITASYNDDMAQDFSRYTRDGIDEQKTFPHDIVYSDIFPGSKIKDGNASFQQWALEGNFFNYKGAGVGGGVTGKGCNVSIVDDPVKDAEEAFNSNRLQKIWTWYTGTFLSRKEQGGVEIVNMTRWAKGDICGRILEGKDAGKWFVLLLEAHYEDQNQMLCPELLDFERYEELKNNVEESIFWANYHQKPVDIKGRLYKEFKTYVDLPKDEEGNVLFERVVNYTDTADTGEDYLASICAGLHKGYWYVLDVLYTKQPMEETEPETANLLVRNNVQISHIESNNGGRGFARNVEREIYERYGSRRIAIQWFHQSKNKQARIFANSNTVQNTVIYPVNWRDRWPEYYAAMTQYQREGKNKNDDAPDATTGLVETLQTPQPRSRVL